MRNSDKKYRTFESHENVDVTRMFNSVFVIQIYIHIIYIGRLDINRFLRLIISNRTLTNAKCKQELVAPKQKSRDIRHGRS